MAYQRFVSYIYEYPDGKKGENCGFVRVEIRNGMCRMGFWLKACGFPEESSLKIFGLVKEQKRLIGVLTGELAAGPAGARGYVSFPEQEIGKSPYGMEQFGGLLLLSAGGRKFATQWKDEPLNMMSFEEWKKSQDSRQHEAPGTEEQKTNPLEMEEEDYDHPVNIQEENNGEETEKKSTEEEMKTDPENISFSQKNIPMAAEIPVCRPEICTDTNETESTVHSECVDAQKSFWTAIQKKCMHFQPFPDDSMTECVRVIRQELPELKKTGWKIDGNPFINYGLNSYHHLLLGRDAEQPEVYYLGVPGVFNTNEQFMAGMFGFGQFRAANPPAGGRVSGSYGYWCRRIYPV